MAEEIRALLARRRISGRQLAEATGMSQSAVSARLTGTTAIDLDDLDRIAAALELDPLDLFPAEVAEPTPTAPMAPRVVATAGQRRSRRLTGSYPARVGGASPVRSTGHVAPAGSGPHHSPDRPPNRPDHNDADRPVRLSRPATPKRGARRTGDDVL